MENKRTFRRTCLGLLCGGALLVGVGIGVQMTAFSGLSYGGVRLVDSTPHSIRQTIELGEIGGPVSFTSYDYRGRELDLGGMGRVEARNSVQPGTLEVELSYFGTPAVFGYWTDTREEGQDIGLYLNVESDLAYFLACKDQVLTDIRQGQLSDYVPWQVTEVVIGVNPEDLSQVHLE